MPWFTRGVLEGTIAGREGATPYVRFGDALVVAISLALLAWWRAPGDRRLTFTVDGGEVAGGALHGSDGGLPRMRFSDGTVISFAAGARARLLSVRAAGARLVLDDGTADVEVVHRPGRLLRRSIHCLSAGRHASQRYNGIINVHKRKAMIVRTNPSSDDAAPARSG